MEISNKNDLPLEKLERVKSKGDEGNWCRFNIFEDAVIFAKGI